MASYSEMFQFMFDSMMDNARNKREYKSYLGTGAFVREFCTSVHTVQRQTGKTKFLVDLIKKEPYNFVVLVPNRHLKQEYLNHGIRCVYSVSEYELYLRGKSSVQPIIILLDEVSVEESKNILGLLCRFECLYAIFGLNTRV